MEVVADRVFSIPHRFGKRILQVTKRIANDLPYFTVLFAVPARKLLFAGRHNGDICMFNFEDKENGSMLVTGVTTTFSGHESRVSCLYYTEQHRLLFSGSVDGVVRVWDPFTLDDTQRCTQQICSHSRAITALSMHENMIISGSIDGHVCTYQADTRKKNGLMYPWFYEVQCIEHDINGWVCSLAASPSRRVGEAADLVVGTSSGDLVLFISEPVPYAETGLSFRFNFTKVHGELHPLAVTFTMVLVKENMIVTLCNDKTLRVLESMSGKPFFTLVNPRGNNYVHCDWNEDAKELLIVDEEAVVDIWKYDTLNTVYSKKLSPTAIHQVMWIMDGSDRFATAGVYGVNFWHVSREEGARRVEGHTDAVVFIRRVSLTAHEERLYTVGHDKRMLQWVVFDEGLNCLNSREETEGEVTSFFCWGDEVSVFSPKEFLRRPLQLQTSARVEEEALRRVFLFTGHDNGKLRATYTTNERYHLLQAHDNAITGIACGYRLWDAKERAMIPDPHIYTVSYDGCMGIWRLDVSSGAPFLENIDMLRISDAELLCVLSNPSNDTVITGGNDGIIRVWQMGRQIKLLHSLEGHAGSVSCLERDANFLFSSGADKKIFVWDLLSGTCLRQLSCHEGEVTDMRMLPISGALVSCGLDGMLVRWNYTNGRMVRKIQRSEPLHCMDVDVRSHMLFLGTANGTVLQIDLDKFERDQDRPKSALLSKVTLKGKALGSLALQKRPTSGAEQDDDKDRPRPATAAEVRFGTNVRRTLSLPKTESRTNHDTY